MRETGKGKGTDPPLGPPGRKMVQPTPFFLSPVKSMSDIRLLKWSTVRQQVYVVLSHKVGANLLQRPWKINTACIYVGITLQIGILTIDFG